MRREERGFPEVSLRALGVPSMPLPYGERRRLTPCLPPGVSHSKTIDNCFGMACNAEKEQKERAGERRTATIEAEGLGGTALAEFCFILCTLHRGAVTEGACG